MSKYLGPIHYWLYNKIKFQNAVVNQVIEFSEENQIVSDLKQDIEEKFGSLSDKPLEDIIDESNIHGWLQKQVSVVEYRFAYAVTSILNKDKNHIEEIKTIFFNYSKNNAEIGEEEPSYAFKYLNDKLLDGMPCDRANAIVSQEENEVIWKRNVCLHKSYWDAVGGDINVYYTLREALIKGMLHNSNLYYERVDEVTNKIARR